MDQDAILMSYLVLELTDRFNEWLAFDITDRTADLDNRNFCLGRFVIVIESALDLICDVWDHLHCASGKFSASFFVQNTPIYFSGGNVRADVKIFINETLIVSKI